MLNNVSDNDDICQDIFIKAYLNISKFKFDSRLSTWVARIAYTTCISHFQKKKIGLLDDIVTRDEENRPVEGFLKDIVDDSKEMPDELLFTKELKTALDNEINSLPSLFKTIICLYHQEELSYLEIAGIMDLPVGTVKSYLFRGRKLLKENLLKKNKQKDLL
jgi:RNA polymerase sigma-70 factor (ECF subfamily)